MICPINATISNTYSPMSSAWQYLESPTQNNHMHTQSIWAEFDFAVAQWEVRSCAARVVQRTFRRFVASRTERGCNAALALKRACKHFRAAGHTWAVVVLQRAWRICLAKRDWFIEHGGKDMVIALQRKWRLRRSDVAITDNAEDSRDDCDDKKESKSESEGKCDSTGAHGEEEEEVDRDDTVEFKDDGEGMANDNDDVGGGVADYNIDNTDDNGSEICPSDDNDLSTTDGVDINNKGGDRLGEDGDYVDDDRGSHSDTDWKWHENLLRAIARNLRQLDILRHTSNGVDKPLKDAREQDGEDDSVHSVKSTDDQMAEEEIEEVLNFDNAVYRYWREADIRAVDPSRCLMSFVCIGDDALLGVDEGTKPEAKTMQDMLGKELAPEGYYGPTQKRRTVFQRARELAMNENTSSRIRRIRTQLRDAWTYIGAQTEDKVNGANHSGVSLLLPGPVMWQGAFAEGIKEAMPWARETFCFAQILQQGLVSEEKLRRCFIRAQLLQHSVRTPLICRTAWLLLVSAHFISPKLIYLSSVVCPFNRLSSGNAMPTRRLIFLCSCLILQ